MGLGSRFQPHCKYVVRKEPKMPYEPKSKLLVSPLIMENQMEKKMENEMETGLYRGL